MKFLALLSSVSFESELVLTSLKNVRTSVIAGKKICRGKLSGRDTLLMNTGIGKVNAAHAATCVIENLPVEKIINFGVGGAYPDSGLTIGDVAIATKEIYGDEGVAGLQSWKGMKEIDIPLAQEGRKKYFNEFSASPLSHGEKTVGSPKIKKGAFVTVSSTSGVRSRAVELERRFKAICENMEGAAIAHVCTIYKIPFFEIRGISNIAGVRDKSTWNLRLASKNCQRAVLEIMKIL